MRQHLGQRVIKGKGSIFSIRAQPVTLAPDKITQFVHPLLWDSFISDIARRHCRKNVADPQPVNYMPRLKVSRRLLGFFLGSLIGR